MVDTIKFSQMAGGGDLAPGEMTPGLLAGANVLFNNPWTFLAPGSTASRPVPTADIDGRLRFNTDTLVYEYYDTLSSTWVELSGSGTGTINPGVTNDLAFYAANGTNLSPIAALANAVLVTSSGSVPSLSTTLPLGLAIPGAVITASTAALTSGQITAVPVNPTDIVNKSYVDSAVGGDVTSITGTTNQVLVNHPTGAVTLSLPQDIATGSTPTFSSINLGSAKFTSNIGLLDSNGNTILGLNAVGSAVNSFEIQNAATSGGPVLSAIGSDANIPVVLLSKGISPVFLQAAATGTNPSVTFNTGTTYQHATNFIFPDTAATRSYTWPDASGTVALTSTSSGVINSGLINQLAWYAAAGTTISGLATSASGVLITSAGSVPSISTTLPSGLTIPLPIIVDSNGKDLLTFTTVASAVNYLGMQNAATGGAPDLLSLGTDPNINLNLVAKGTGFVIHNSTSNTGLAMSTGTGYQHSAFFAFTNAATSQTYTFPEATGTVYIVGQALGTPSSATLTNATGLPIAGIAGLGTGVATALAANVVGSGGIALDTDSTWTPVLTFGGASVGITYSTQSGSYSRVGNMVTFCLWISLTNKGSSTGAAFITLPIAQRAGTSLTCFSIVPGFTNTTTVIAYGSPSSTLIGLQSYSGVGAAANVTDTNFSNTSLVIIGGSYLV